MFKITQNVDAGETLQYCLGDSLVRYISVSSKHSAAKSDESRPTSGHDRCWRRIQAAISHASHR